MSLPESRAFCPKNYIISVAGGGEGGGAAAPRLVRLCQFTSLSGRVRQRNVPNELKFKTHAHAHVQRRCFCSLSPLFCDVLGAVVAVLAYWRLNNSMRHNSSEQMKKRLTQQYKIMKFRMSRQQGPPLRGTCAWNITMKHHFAFIDVMRHCTKQGSQNSIQESKMT